MRSEAFHWKYGVSRSRTIPSFVANKSWYDVFLSWTAPHISRRTPTAMVFECMQMWSGCYQATGAARCVMRMPCLREGIYYLCICIALFPTGEVTHISTPYSTLVGQERLCSVEYVICVLLYEKIANIQRLVTGECGDTDTLRLLVKKCDAVVEYMKLYYVTHICKDTDCTHDASHSLLVVSASTRSAHSSCRNCIVPFQNFRNHRSALPSCSECCNETLHDAKERLVFVHGSHA